MYAQGKPTPLLIHNYIIANRKLQVLTNKNNNPQRNHHSVLLLQALNIETNVSNSRLELELWLFLQQNWKECVSNEDIVKAYIMGSNSSNVNNQFELVLSHFRQKFEESPQRNANFNSSVVLTFVRVLLGRNDYQNCFKLLDETYNSPSLLELKQKHLERQTSSLVKSSLVLTTLGGCISAHFDVSLVQYLIVPGFCLSFLGTMLVSFGLGLSRINELSRISWRPYVSFRHRYLNREHSSTLNQIVTYFEEHNEINIKNYHLRQVNEGAFRETVGDYELITPRSQNFNNSNDFTSNVIAENSNLIRSELLKRKLRWNCLKEEQMFLEFWMSHGDNFEWVEPDQDPAEIFRKI